MFGWGKTPEQQQASQDRSDDRHDERRRRRDVRKQQHGSSCHCGRRGCGSYDDD